ncbi:hypothetical protein BCE75_1214 [Isoptericola sp. CG 20/1183]|uniref:DUF2199 domain-containing protein n=1 Tax=Isoptericola halotolerans TaxID=300560 RepID=A0ABX5EDD5_9MICO|nr:MULTISPECIES: DUF2199 domain-containing protein [Isoptericola]PRZ02422.1 hypothetical protein BCE75_1214 [Isoptericola sp. CG 20/1183]PRZ02727.1 hypothetical protein BCL65_1189 [Isoptericola halotolerans]
MTSTAWTCALCGTTHEGLAMVFGPRAPDPWMLASDDERVRSELNADMCVLVDDAGSTNYFMRGHIVIPIIDSDDGPFCWSVWVSLSEASMRTQTDHWSDPDRAQLEPMFAWLCNNLPYEPSTAPMAARLHTNEPGTVPWVELDPAIDHPLVHEQLHGITLHRVAEINRAVQGDQAG